MATWTQVHVKELSEEESQGLRRLVALAGTQKDLVSLVLRFLTNEELIALKRRELEQLEREAA